MKPILISLCFFICAVYIFNAPWIHPSQEKNRELLAHRGLHQTYSPFGINDQTCTASRIETPQHDYIENTLASISAAVDLGADIVEIDIHPTIDGEFIVFHDWELECRTDGTGVVREQTLSYLKSLDVAYGYTADNGKTYPFRDKYVGAMPTLAEVLSTFQETKILINIKSNDSKEAQQLTEYLRVHQFTNRQRLSVYGSGENIPVFADLNPDIKTLYRKQAKSCIKRYILLGWTGYMPQPCNNSLIPIPKNYQWLIWGWPNLFESRLEKVNSRPMLMGAHKKDKANSGIDDIESIPENFGGIILTNRIDIIGKKGLR